MKAPSLTVVRMLISPGSGDGTNKFTVSFFLQEYGRLIRFLPRFFAFGGFHRGFMCYRIFVASLVSLQGGQKPSNGGQIIYELYEGNPINLHHPLKSLVPPKFHLVYDLQGEIQKPRRNVPSIAAGIVTRLSFWLMRALASLIEKATSMPWHVEQSSCILWRLCGNKHPTFLFLTQNNNLFLLFLNSWFRERQHYIFSFFLRV